MRQDGPANVPLEHSSSGAENRVFEIGGSAVPYLELYTDDDARANFEDGFRKGEIDQIHIYSGTRWRDVSEAKNFTHNAISDEALSLFLESAAWREALRPRRVGDWPGGDCRALLRQAP